MRSCSLYNLKIKRKELHMPRNILEAYPWWWSNAGSQQNHVPIWWGLSIGSEQKTELWNKAQCIQQAWPEEGAASQHSCCAQYWALQPWNTNFFVTLSLLVRFNHFVLLLPRLLPPACLSIQ
jgi:hypothetical protein